MARLIIRTVQTDTFVRAIPLSSIREKHVNAVIRRILRDLHPRYYIDEDEVWALRESA